MVPRPILRQLARLRRRELLLRLAWGLSRAVTVVLLLLGAACLTDWLIDRWQETPWALRLVMAGGQLAAATAVLLFWLARPLLRVPAYPELALQVEDRVPALGHRLISAVELNRPGALTQGMSPELIARVTAEAQEQAARVRVRDVTDHRRLGWSVCLATPFVLAAGALYLAWPETVEALLGRQLLADREIPRTVRLAVAAPAVWYRPRGEEVVLRFRARGERVADGLSGDVRIEPAGRPAEHYPLALEAVTGPGEAVYAARVPPGATDFTYRAWLDDGRTPRPAEVRYAARPVVIEQRAWVLLPASIGLRPRSKTPYEQEQPRAEVVAVKGSSARVQVATQKPIKQAVVELLASSFFGLGPEKVTRRVTLAPTPDGKGAVGSFLLHPEETAYRVLVKDEHGFDNIPPPRRGIRVIPEDPPQVTLLREEFRPVGRLAALTGPATDFEVEGMPVPQGGRIRIAYACTGPYGVGSARLRFRVLKKSADGDLSAPAEDERWLTLPLIEVQGSTAAGPFDPRRGVFLRSGEEEQVQFHAVPSADPEKLPGRIQGGGRFDFSTRGIPDGQGGYIDLQPGDQLEYYVEVFADRDPHAGRPSARSEVRRKAVVTVAELVRWLDETLQEERRIRRLESKQRGVFDTD